MTSKIITIIILALLAISIFAGFVQAINSGPIISNDYNIDGENHDLYIKGDVNEDGVFDELDFQFMLDYIIGNGQEPEISVADYNNDGIIDSDDLVSLLDELIRLGIIVVGGVNDDPDPVEEELLLIGDVNEDGKIDLDDVHFMIDRIFAGGPASNPESLMDFNEDGRFNIADVTALISYLVDQGIITVDTTAPIIELIDPDDGDVLRTRSEDIYVDFDYIVRDESDIASCSLIIDGRVKKTKHNIERNVMNFFEYELDSDEEYDWRIECIDIHGNKGISERWDFEIEKRDKISSDNDRIDYTPKDDDNLNQNNPPIILNEGNDNLPEENYNLRNFLAIALALANIFLISLIFVFGYRR